MNSICKSALLVFLIGGLVSCAQTSSPPDTEAKTPAARIQKLSEAVFFEGTKVVVDSNLKLDANTSGSFKRFSASPNAFSAMYVRPDGTGWGYYTSGLSLDEAKQASKTRCDTATGRNCILYATLSPASPPPPNAIPASYKKRLANAAAKNDVGKFIAVSSNHVEGSDVTWGHDTAEQAAAATLKSCQEVGQVIAQRLGQTRAATYRSRGLFDCQLIGLYRE